LDCSSSHCQHQEGQAGSQEDSCTGQIVR
jgi:hypothetical protein